MAVSTTPTYPVVDEVVTITDTSLTGDLVVIELTSAPSASTMDLGFLISASATTPTSIQDILEREIQISTATFDEPGEYGVTFYDVYRFEGAPSHVGDTAEIWYQFIATYTGTIHVSATVDLPMLTAAGDGATLRLTINDATCRAATIVNATTEKARVAALQATVTAPVALLVGTAITSLNDSLDANVSDLRAKYEAHRVTVGGIPIHLVADSTNACSLTDADSNEGAIALLNELRVRITAHLSDATSAAAPWHTEDDLKNLPLARAATDLGSATVLSADLRERVYELHRAQAVSPACHGAADGNALKVPSRIDNAVNAYLDALAIENPTVVAGEPEGAIDAEHKYGFVRS